MAAPELCELASSAARAYGLTDEVGGGVRPQFEEVRRLPPQILVSCGSHFEDLAQRQFLDAADVRNLLHLHPGLLTL